MECSLSSKEELEQELEELEIEGVEEPGLDWEGSEGREGAEEQRPWSFLGRLRLPEESCC